MAASNTADIIEAFIEEAGLEGGFPPAIVQDIDGDLLTLYVGYLASTLSQLSECTFEVASASIQWPNELGDLAVVVPKLRLDKSSNLPNTAAQLQKEFPPNPLFEHPFEDGVNLRFYFKPDTLARLLLVYIIDRGKAYGTNRLPGDASKIEESGHKKVIVEFCSPNIGKEVDGYHSRSALVGNYVSSLFENMGWNVVRANFVGDWGKHIGLLAAAWSRFKSEEELQAAPMAHLLEIFRKANELSRQITAEKQQNNGSEIDIDAEKDEFFRLLELHDPDSIALWQKFKDIFAAEHNKFFERVNIKFDDQNGESSFRQETMQNVEAALKEKGIYKESDGAWILDFEKLNIPGLRNTIARFRNGTTSYLLRDIAAFYERQDKYVFDLMVYVASSTQSTHFDQLFKVLEVLEGPDVLSKVKHLSVAKMQNQNVRSEGSGIMLQDVLDDCRTAVATLIEVSPDDMSEFPQDDPGLTESLGLSGLVVQTLSHRHSAPVVVDVDKIATNDGHTGIALQQWYLALRLRLKGVAISRDDLAAAQLSLFSAEDYADVLRLLIQYPGIVKNTFKKPSYEATVLLAYLFRLVDGIGQVWECVKDEDEGGSSSKDEVAENALFECVRQVLENGMRILGIVPLEL
ncbi:hypothetical protein S40288_06179 [Stachybotrys chartarum IBT 40288]|nr:hypothetical protein S40288_06179 [Stachybotrys chartarum IBT 40288]